MTAGASVSTILTLVFISLRLSQISADEKSLYAPGDNVLELDVTNFDSSVFHQQRAFFVEFYSSWCGHCINYKPKWVEFATNLKDWSSVVQVTVINCADEKNSPVCREHEIDAFPTLKYFPPGSSSKEDGQKFTGDKYDLDSMTLELVKLVHGDYLKSQPNGWPKLTPTESHITLDRLWAEADSTKKVLAVVVDEEPLLTAYATMINYVRNPFVKVAALKPDHPIAVQFGGVSIPTLHVFKKENQNNPDFSSHQQLKFVEIQKKIDEYVSEVVDSGHQAPAPMHNQMENDVRISLEPNQEVPINWDQYKVQNMDILSAMKYMLHEEIPRKPVIKDENLAALKAWIHILKKYLPGTTSIRRLFYRLDEWTQLQSSITAEQWLEKVETLQKDLGNPLPQKPKWIACQGSKPFLRGYTCGLWTTMHAVTVQAYMDEKDNPQFKPVNDVLEPIHGFIYRFLSCQICAQNFHKMAVDTNALSLVTRTEDVVLWLWRAHNSANKRLSKDASEDPQFPKRQFPPEPLCHDCQVNGIFLEDRVLHFMTKYYTDIRTDGMVPDPGYKVTEFENGKVQKVANKHLNPKFNVRAEKIDQVEEAESRIRNLDGSPKRTWRNIENENYGSVTPAEDRSTFYFIWLVIIILGLVLAYSKYKQNRSKFWKYYYSEYKL